MSRITLSMALVLFSLFATTLFAQERKDVSPRAIITQGVTSIASAGLPGPIAVFGPKAFVVATGKENGDTQLPVVAGALWGRGRVLAFGHGGMIGGDAITHEGTQALLINSVKWLAGERAEPRIGVVGNSALSSMLTDHGLQAATLTNDWHNNLPSINVLVIDSHQVGENDREAVAEFVKRGGGLLTAGLGWGWLQLHPGKTIDDHPGNQLLRDAGLAWCDGSVSTTADDGFAIGPVPDSLHAGHAMHQLMESAAGNGEFDAQAGATLIAALRVVPATHPLYRQASQLLAKQADSLVISEAKPLRQRDAMKRVLVALQVEQEKRTLAERVHAQPSAANFPGEVPSGAARVQRDVEIDLRVPGWQSTGLYAPAGQLVVVTAPDATNGCGVRIGCHTDQLWHQDVWKRVPDIARHWDLEAGINRVASAFGGLVYIEVPKGKDGCATFNIRGAVEAPHFVLGATSDDEWMKAREAPGPWGELESKKVIVSVPSSALRALDNPTALMEFWDKISDAHATLAMIPLDPSRPHRFVADVQISAGYMHSGYPIMTHLDAADDMTSLAKLTRGSWGLLHELGHNHQQGDWTFAGTTEVTCNLFALHAIDTICTPTEGERGHSAVDNPPSLKKYLDGGAKFEEWKREPFLALHMYVQMQKAFGWETFQKVFAEYQTLKPNERPKNDDEKRDQWMVRFSRACGRNLGPFFEAWGVPTSDEARASLADLPAWMPDDWPNE